MMLRIFMSTTTEKILEAVESLPEARRREVLDYVESLRAREDEMGERDPSENPLLDFIGGAEHGSLAQNIDDELYGA
jgi:hypothetical protein